MASCPDTCTLGKCPLSCAQVEYLPSVAANGIFIALFVIVLIAQLGLGIAYKTWGFMIGMVCGLILEVVGYAGRLMLHHDPFDFNNFIIYLVPLTIGPAFLTAAIYLCLARIVITHGVSLARISPKWTSIIFMFSDFVSLILQAAGGALAATGDDGSSDTTGRDIMIAGLAWQVISLGCFLLLWGDYAWRLRSAPEPHKSQDATLKSIRTGSQKFYLFQYALLIATVLILIRSIYRVAELSGGFNGSIANNQASFIALESVPVILAVSAITVFHPGLAFERQWASAGWSLRRDRKGVDSSEMSRLSQNGDSISSDDGLGVHHATKPWQPQSHA